jgi:hypothetical protein
VGVLVQLLPQVPPLTSGDPEGFIKLFKRLDETYELGLVEGRYFIMSILPLVSSNLLAFVGNCLRERSDWTECKTPLLEDYFPYFVGERVIGGQLCLIFTRRVSLFFCT